MTMHSVRIREGATYEHDGVIAPVLRAKQRQRGGRFDLLLAMPNGRQWWFGEEELELPEPGPESERPHAFVRQHSTGSNFCAVPGCSLTLAEHDESEGE